MIKIQGKVKYIKYDFYILQVSSGDFITIESSDELEMDDIISWNDYDDFYNITQNDEISARIQSNNANLQKAIKELDSW